MNALGQVRDRLVAAAVLARRGMVDPTRPDQALRAFVAMRRYGALGGLTAYTAARYGDAPAITDDDGTITFRELDETSNALARGLQALQANGVRSGWVIGMLNRNHRSVMLTLSAANKIGVRVVLMNTGFAGPQLADVSAREDVRCVIADDEFVDLLGVLPGETMRIDSSQQRELIDGRSRSSLPAPSRPGGMVLLTSGTTGTPKGAPRNKIDPLQSAQLLDRIPWPRDGAYCVAAPLFHATGLATCALGLALGNRVVLARRFDPESTCASIAEHRADALVLVPTMLQRILDLGPETLGRYNTSSLDIVFAAGSALYPDVCRRTAEAVGDVLYNLYGSTEVAAAAVATPQELRAAPGTVGRPPVGCTLACYESSAARSPNPDKRAPCSCRAV